MQGYEQTQLNLGLRTSRNPNFQSVLDYIDDISSSAARKGILFERLMQQYFLIDPIYQERFSEVYLYKEWGSLHPSRNPRDLGIDLVAVEQDGTYCAIQCKCYGRTTRITKPDIDSFIAESSRADFTARMIVDTGGAWGKNAINAIKGITPACSVIRFGDLEQAQVNWPDLSVETPDAVTRKEPYELFTHQQNAFDDVIKGFETNDRGQMIMACGTGKTFVSLRIAEKIAGTGGIVLYLVPSIALLGQAMREWAEQKQLQHRYLGICSDATAGNAYEDMAITELEIPVTTDPIAIGRELSFPAPNKMTVVFSTYHSLPIVEEAMHPFNAKESVKFDLILCDEAHRTTGKHHPQDDISHFNLVHDGLRIKAKKRLYMTATPKLYTEGIKNQAAQHDIGVFSMDDEETYGPEFHRLPFSKAVELGQLSDYKVVLLGISESEAEVALQAFYQSGGSEISITDATKIVGCWRALSNPERKPMDDETIKPLRRAIAFTNRIADSRRVATHWNAIIEQATKDLPDEAIPSDFTCETAHVDGTMSAFVRKSQLEWLRSETEGECRILSNARCLSEGVDVPALDAVLFMAPRQSHVDIVQAVGRVMRKAPGKNVGYIILPVAIPEGVSPENALDNNERFATVWSVLRALRAHDDRFNIEVNHIDLNIDPGDRIIIDGGGRGAAGEQGEQGQTWQQQVLFPISFPADKIYAKIVEKCGDREYWENWAKDVADIFTRLTARIKNLIGNPQNTELQQAFVSFHNELKQTINDAITHTHARDMIAQHILTNPVFEALFEDYDFTQHNPVARALETLHTELQGYGLENETRDLQGFYESVQRRAQGIDNTEGRQRVLLELYERFFKIALKKEAERLGIIYTPDEVVDFILHSVNDVLDDEFGLQLTSEGVNVLDPFTGTGTFIVRLFQSKLIEDKDLLRKYQHELHAVEMVLLAYYIATANIEGTFGDRQAEDAAYQPFENIVFADTFNLNPYDDDEQLTLFPKGRLVDNSERAETQQELPIEIIIGNPPWSGKQRRASDNNQNVVNPLWRDRIKDTYVKKSTATLKNSLYDTYKMAIRWATDRIKEKGIIAFVTNGSWIDGNADSGVRACFEKEFSSIYVLHLRGNQRTQGERSRQEGGKIFGSGSRAPVAITILVKNPNATHEGCKIQYRDIGNYLTREEKLDLLREKVSIKGFDDWRTITPDKHYDWVQQRSEIFETFYPMGRKKGIGNTVFTSYAPGLATGRDAYIYNFSRDDCAENAKLMTQDYLNAMSELEENPDTPFTEIISRHATHIKWNPELRNNLKRMRETEFDETYIRKALYRPFIPTNCYKDYTFITRKGLMDRIFPETDTDNKVICIPGISGKKDFSVVMTGEIPDLNLKEGGAQCFPRYWYPIPTDTENGTDIFIDTDEVPERIDNITDTVLHDFCEYYQDNTITKDAIFNYVYGILHAPNYLEQFAYDLTKMLPHIPYAPDFWGFAKVGAELAALHLNYETCEQYLDLRVERLGQQPQRSLFEPADQEPEPEHFMLGTKAMKFADDKKTKLIINEHVCVSGIPQDAHKYVVNGRTPLEWFMDRYKIKQDKENGIVNDPNGWFDTPRDLITAIERIVYVSVESTKIIESLPSEVTSG